MSEMNSLQNSCLNRIKPQLLRDIKTEALLVFARTALERYFIEVDNKNIVLSLKTKEEETLDSTLRTFLRYLQEHVVSADYLIYLSQNERSDPLFQILLKQ